MQQHQATKNTKTPLFRVFPAARPPKSQEAELHGLTCCTLAANLPTTAERNAFPFSQEGPEEDLEW